MTSLLNKEPRVMLVSMPWAPVTEPSLALAQLAGELGESNIATDVFHASLYLLKYLRYGSYTRIADLYAINDFLFTKIFYETLDERQVEEIHTLAKNILQYDWRWKADFDSHLDLVDYLLLLRNDVIPSYIEMCAQRVIEYLPTLVGFTCLFDQTISSLALAKKIKEKINPLIALGGYAVNGSKSETIIRSMDYVDIICSGDGESQIVPLARASVNRNYINEVTNSIFRDSEKNTFGNIKNSPTVIHRTFKADKVDLNERATPDFSFYFSEIHELNTKEKISVNVSSLPIENSRGCWWGQKHHCTFCGIDKNSLVFRESSSERTLSKLDYLKKKHEINNFRFIDYILPYSYYSDFIPLLSKRVPGIKFGCEIKSNITPKQAAALKHAGAYEVQPGIESFSTDVLKRMRKGVKGIQNIACLIYMKYHGISVNYNLLFGTPGDKIEEYYEISSIIPLLYHLDSPYHTQKIEITTGSELYENWGDHGFPREPMPKRIYDIVFSKKFYAETQFNYHALSYYFENEFTYEKGLESVYKIILHQIGHWKKEKARRDVKLEWKQVGNNRVEFLDTRYTDTLDIKIFEKEHLNVIKSLGLSLTGRQSLIRDLYCQMNEQEVDTVLADLLQNRFIFIESNLIINLAIPHSRH